MPRRLLSAALVLLASASVDVVSALPPACTAGTRPVVINSTNVGRITATAAGGGTFPAGLDCQWLILAPSALSPSSSLIDLTWSYVDCGSDETCDLDEASVSAYQVNGALAPGNIQLLDEQCFLPDESTSPSPSDPAYGPFTSLTGKMLVQLKVNAPGTAAGFEARFSITGSPAPSVAPSTVPSGAPPPPTTVPSAVPSSAPSTAPPAASPSSAVAASSSSSPAGIPSPSSSAAAAAVSPSPSPSSSAAAAASSSSSPAASVKAVSPSRSAASPSASASASASTPAVASSPSRSPVVVTSPTRRPSAVSPSPSPSKSGGSPVVPSMPAMPAPLPNPNPNPAAPDVTSSVALITLKGEKAAWQAAAGGGDDASYLYAAATGLASEIASALQLDSANGVRISAYPTNINTGAVLGGCPGDRSGSASIFRCVVVQLWPAGSQAAQRQRRQLQNGPSVTLLVQQLRTLLSDPSSLLRRETAGSASFGSGLSPAGPWVSGVWASPPSITFVYSGANDGELLFPVAFDQTGSKGAHGGSGNGGLVSQSVTVKNSGGSPLTVFSAATSTVGNSNSNANGGGAANLFLLTDPPATSFPLVIGAGQSVVFTVAVNPAAVIVPLSPPPPTYSLFGFLELQHSLPTGDHTVPLVITVSGPPSQGGGGDTGDIVPTSMNFKAGAGVGVAAFTLIFCVCGLTIWRCCVCCKRRRERKAAIKGGAPSGVKATRLPEEEENDEEGGKEGGNTEGNEEKDRRRKEKAKFKDSEKKAKKSKKGRGADASGRVTYSLDSSDDEAGDDDDDDSDGDNDVGMGSRNMNGGNNGNSISMREDDRARLNFGASGIATGSFRQHQQQQQQQFVSQRPQEVEMRTTAAQQYQPHQQQQPAATVSSWSFPPGVSASVPLPASSAPPSLPAAASSYSYSSSIPSSLRLKPKPHIKAGDFEPCWLRLQSVELFGFSLPQLPSQTTNELEKLLMGRGIACLASGNVPGAGGSQTFKYYFYAQREDGGSSGSGSGSGSGGLEDSLCLAEVSIAPSTATTGTATGAGAGAGAGFRMSCVVKAKEAATAAAFAGVFKQAVAPIVSLSTPA